MDTEYVIRIPIGALDNKVTAKRFIFDELNKCFLEYKDMFDMYPNKIEFKGKRGKKMYDIAKDIFNGVYECSCNEHWNDLVVFSNTKQPFINSKDLKTIDVDKSSMSVDGLVIPGIHGLEAVKNVISSYGGGISVERDIPTELEFVVYDIESQDVDMSDLAPNDFVINLF